MRSFIKSHRRGSSGALDEQTAPQWPNGSGSGISLSSTTYTSGDATSFVYTSPVQSFQTSPIRSSHTNSPSFKGNKLQRLFLRSKSSSTNLELGNPSSPGKGSSPPTTIVGTRTHEWGSSPSHDTIAKLSTRPNTADFSSSNASISSSGESNRASYTSALRLSKDLSNEDTDFLQLPLNTVLEIPDHILPSVTGSTTEVTKKNRHRRAQIVTADSPMSQLQPGTPTLGDPVHILPTLDGSIFDQVFDALDSESDTNVKVPLGLDPAAEIISATPSTIHYDDTNKTIELIEETDKQQHDNTGDSDNDNKKKDDKPEENDTNSTHESEFSFEQDGAVGRNTSVRYYKNLQDVIDGEPAHTAREQGFYVNDLVEDDFDDDMNYFDEDDDFNDDEELFNKKYFSDDEDEPVSKMKQLTINEASEDDGPVSSTPFTSPKQEANSQRIIHEEKSQVFEDLNSLRPARSLKYHQLPVSYEHEFSERRYSWLSDEENDSNRGSQSYDSLLDEINIIPDDFDYEGSTNSGTRSKTLNSSLKRNQGVMEDLPQNTKFQTNDKTVTLFHRSRTGSLRSHTSSPEHGDAKTQVTTPFKEEFSYMTPNSSFTTPHPMFKNERDVELSPISEGSLIEDSYYSSG